MVTQLPVLMEHTSIIKFYNASVSLCQLAFVNANHSHINTALCVVPNHRVHI